MKRQFPKNSGLTGFYNDKNEWTCTGSRMGRISNKAHEIQGKARLRVRRVHLDAGGYDDGGAYWGTPSNLYEARGEDAEQQLSFFTRAADRAEAVHKFRAELRNVPDCKIS